jgi:murein L,D-transpeptidase YcbB/YkuD
VDINLPAYRMDVYEGDSSWSAPIAIGMRKYASPIGTFRIRSVTWNPWWIPPNSEWARKEKPKPPGPDNPMGTVKLQIADLVFLHGTPWVESLGRAASHACVRMADSSAIRLAAQVHRLQWGDATGDSIRVLLDDSTHSRRIDIEQSIPVVMRYRLAEVRKDTLWLYPNVYRRSGASVRAHALEALTAASIDTSRVDRRALDAALRRSRTTSVSMPLAMLVRPE